jgi:hypothetical protein
MSRDAHSCDIPLVDIIKLKGQIKQLKSVFGFSSEAIKVAPTHTSKARAKPMALCGKSFNNNAGPETEPYSVFFISAQ